MRLFLGRSQGKRDFGEGKKGKINKRLMIRKGGLGDKWEARKIGEKEEGR